MMIIPRIPFCLALLLLTFTTSNAWTARNPLAYRGSGVTSRTLSFLDEGRTKPRPLPASRTTTAVPRRNRWLRSLASMAGLVLLTTLSSPTAAFASTEILPTLTSLPKPIPTMVEIQLTVRLLMASLLGAAVGKERSSTHKHSAGVRTMALVALGACAFTVCSSFGFLALGAAKCDPSRMASNVASGVGFVGAGVITTHSANPNDSRQSIVHGLTTATAIWISAAIGVACGVGMFFIASAATILTITILRFGGMIKNVKQATRKVEEKIYHAHSGLFSTSRRRNLAAPQVQMHVAATDIPVPVMPLTLGSNSTTTAVLPSNTASLEELNEDDDWDSHVEIVISEDDAECGSEQIVTNGDNNDPTVALPKEEMQRLKKILNIDPDITEFYVRGQATLLEQAHNVALSKNLTGLVNEPQNNSYAAVTEEYTRAYGGNGNDTLGP